MSAPHQQRDPDTGLPASLEAERAILGAILLDNTAYYEAAERGIESDDFSSDSHRRIFSRMADLSETSRAIDIVTLAEELAKHKEIGTAGGVAYLASLTEGLPRRPVIAEYLHILKDKAIARQLMAISSAALTSAADQSQTAIEVGGVAIGRMEASLARGIGRSAKDISTILAEDMPRFNKEADAPVIGTLGADLFTPDLSRITCGIQEGELALLCARPHQGKTEAAIQAIIANAQRGLRVYMFSLEMKSHQIVRRMVRCVAKIPVAKMRDPRTLTGQERDRIVQAWEQLADLHIKIDDTHELTCGEYRSRSVLATKRWKADLIVVDYGQLLLVPKARNIIEAAPKQAETLRHIARDYCRTLALAQLRRAPPNDLNRYPDIEDVLGSSAYEQAAQIVLLLHRSRENKRYTKEDWCIIGKMRESQSIEPLGIKAEPWGQFVDRYA